MKLSIQNHSKLTDSVFVAELCNFSQTFFPLFPGSGKEVGQKGLGYSCHRGPWKAVDVLIE